MSEYGQLITSSSDSSKDTIYKSFSNYFNNPIMQKIKDVEGFSMYMTKIHAMLGNAYRYLIIFVKKDSVNIGEKGYMKDFEWVSLQTRTLEDSHKIQSHHYNANRDPSLSQKLTLKTRNENQTMYEVEGLPLIVTLLHTKKNCTYQYNKTGTVVNALESFQTIITFVG